MLLERPRKSLHYMGLGLGLTLGHYKNLIQIQNNILCSVFWTSAHFYYGIQKINMLDVQYKNNAADTVQKKNFTEFKITVIIWYNGNIDISWAVNNNTVNFRGLI